MSHSSTASAINVFELRKAYANCSDPGGLHSNCDFRKIIFYGSFCKVFPSISENHYVWVWNVFHVSLFLHNSINFEPEIAFFSLAASLFPRLEKQGSIVCVRYQSWGMIDLGLFTYDSCQENNRNTTAQLVKCQLMIFRNNWIFLSFRSCCGADGPNDYIVLRQPLPIECRDTVTGHAFSNGCVDEMTWYLEDKSIWAAAMAMSLAMLHVNKSLSLK